MNVTDVLGESELFHNLDSVRLKTVAGMCRGTSARKDTTLFIEGDEATELYVLQSGRAVLEMQLHPMLEGPVIPTPLEVVSEGGCFGWSALVEPYSYTLSARCLTNCTVLAVKGSRLRDAMASDSDLNGEVMKSLAELIALRLVETRIRLSSGLGFILQGHEISTSI